MKNFIKLLTIFALAAVIGFSFITCDPEDGDDGDPDPGPVAVTFTSLAADGASFSTTTKLTLRLSQSIPGFSKDDITLSGVDGVSKGSLQPSGSTYTLNLTGVTSGGTLTVALAKDGYSISTPSKNVVIFYNAHSRAGIDILSLPSMKEQFEDIFDYIGNIFNAGDATKATGINNIALKRHFNVLTPENEMKPERLCNSASGYNDTNIATAKRMVAAAKADGIAVVGHTLLWHNQIPQWHKDIGNSTEATMPKAQAIEAMKNYIDHIMTEFKGDIYAWDVLNEVFTDSAGTWTTGMRAENPWFKKIGSDFVYEAYLQARESDPNAILLYNDYNLDQSGKATKVRDMVQAVNQKYATENPSATRKLIEGIGMQSHHNTGVSANSIKNTLELFKPLDVKIHISELDVLGFSSYNGLTSGPGEGVNKHTSSKVPDVAGLALQAVRYSEYMALFIQYKGIIKRVSLWGVKDDQSWRSGGLPLLFDHNGKAKASYDAFVVLGDQTVVTPPEAQPIDLTPVKFGDANKNTLKVEINSTTDVVTITATEGGGWNGFYYALPSDWNTYTTIELDWTATVTSGLAKLAVKKGIGENSALVGTAQTEDKYKDVYTGNTYPASPSGTWTWSTEMFVGMTQPGITFQINNYVGTGPDDDPNENLPHNGWTFKVTAIRLTNN